MAIIEMWQHGFGVERLDVNDNFFALGGDSIAAASFFVQLENELGYSTSLATLLQHPTIRELAEKLQSDKDSSTASQQWKTLVPIRPQGSRRPIFCLPGNNGSVLPFRALSTYLDNDTPVLGLQPQGLCGKLAPHTRIPDVAASHIKVMRDAQPAGPYALMGFSFGGTVAFEMARQLTEIGEQVDLLIIIDTPFHGRPWWWREIRQIVSSLREFRRRQRPKPVASNGTWLEGARSMEDLGFPPGRRTVMQTHQLAFETYRISKSTTKLHYLHAMIRPPYPARLFDVPPSRWVEFGGAGSEFQVIPGSHDTLFLPGSIEAVAQHVNRWLRRRGDLSE